MASEAKAAPVAADQVRNKKTKTRNSVFNAAKKLIKAADNSKFRPRSIARELDEASARELLQKFPEPEHDKPRSHRECEEINAFIEQKFPAIWQRRVVGVSSVKPIVPNRTVVIGTKRKHSSETLAAAAAAPAELSPKRRAKPSVSLASVVPTAHTSSG
jgi:hypothetical protein